MEDWRGEGTMIVTHGSTGLPNHMMMEHTI